jgi:murein DD-endopeptidase MepM/ murein hydrolase activator NlpD
MKRIKIFLWTLFGIGIFSACSHTLPNPESLLQPEESETHQASLASLESPEVDQGGIAVIRLQPKDIKPENLHIFWNDREVPHFSPNDKSGIRMALLGIPMGTKPGPSHIEIKTHVEKYLVTESLDLLIKAREVSPERIRVKRKFTTRRARRFVSFQRVQRQSSPSIQPSWSEHPLWEEGFTLPVLGQVTSEFGSCRVFNGKLQTMHNGTDFQARTGDPVRSAAGGRVVLAKRLFLTGKTIIIDHGLGIFTTYAHLSKLLVKKGAMIGDHSLIGLAGSTGRASGSHLHLSAKINGVKVDPLELIRAFDFKKAPETPTTVIDKI